MEPNVTGQKKSHEKTNVTGQMTNITGQKITLITNVTGQKYHL